MRYRIQNLSTARAPKRKHLIVIALCVCGLIGALSYVSVNLIDESDRRINRIKDIKVSEAQGSQSVRKETESDMAVRTKVINNPFQTSMNCKYFELTDRGLSYVSRLSHLKSLDLAYTKITNKGLEYICNLPLEKLDLSETAIGDQGMTSIAKMSQLRILILNGTDITDTGVAIIGRLPLSELHLASTKVTDAGVAEIENCTDLWKVSFSSSMVTNAGIPSLAKLPHLSWVNLGFTEISASGLLPLKSSKELRVIALQGCHVTDADVAIIVENFPLLEDLDLAENEISDKGLLYLTKLRHLGALRVFRCTRITARGVAAFNKNAPQCTLRI